MIYIIDDDSVYAECIARYLRPEKTRIFANAIDAIQNIDADAPRLIFLDILLDGPDGFTFLHELASYESTAHIPVVIITSLSLDPSALREYGVVKVLNKATLTPEEVKNGS